MEKFGLFNVLQTPYSLPDAGSQGGTSFGEKLSAALQAAENVASLFRGGFGAEESAQTAPSASAPPFETQEGQPQAVSAPPPPTARTNTQNTTAQNDAVGRKTASGEAYARFILKQEALSKKIGGGKCGGK
ncbi:MAG: hypothetical protein ACI4SH_01650 [Candidatus Scatosoma sp.]